MNTATKAASPKAVLIDIGDGEFALTLNQQVGPRIGANITPAQVNGILNEADMGRPARLVDLTHEARQRDSHLQAILQVRELSMQALEWDMVPPEGALKRDKKVAGFCKEAIRASRGFPELVAHLTGEPTLFGHGTSETMWGKHGATIIPDSYKNISCRRFAFEQTEGRLVFLETPQAVDGIDLLAKYPGKFIQVRRRINGDVPVREGLCRTLVWGALFRNWSTADWLKLAEGFWKPWRTGKFTKKDPQPIDIEKLKRVLVGMSATGVGITPDFAEINVHWPQFPPSGSQGSPHAELLGYMAREMSKAVLGGTDTVEPGNRGAMASAEVRNEVRHDIRNADALALGAEIKRHLIEPLVRMNFGDSATVPEFFFLTEDPEDVKSFSESILNLRKAGLKIPTSYVYEKIGMNAPKEGDELVGDGLPMTLTAPPQGDPNGDAETKPKPGKKPAAKA
jgi:phage gp29-like protein